VNGLLFVARARCKLARAHTLSTLSLHAVAPGLSAPHRCVLVRRRCCSSHSTQCMSAFTASEVCLGPTQDVVRTKVSVVSSDHPHLPPRRVFDSVGRHSGVLFARQGQGTRAQVFFCTNSTGKHLPPSISYCHERVQQWLRGAPPGTTTMAAATPSFCHSVLP